MLRKTTLALLIAVPTILQADVRKMATITSEPPGGKVWINNVYRGRTPVEVPYNWNWYYDIRVEKEGYEPYCIRERFYAPVKHWIPFDLVAEIAPVKSREAQWRNYVLKPAQKP